MLFPMIAATHMTITFRVESMRTHTDQLVCVCMYLGVCMNIHVCVYMCVYISESVQMTSVRVFVSVFFDFKYVCILQRRTCTNEHTHHTRTITNANTCTGTHSQTTVLKVTKLDNLKKRLRYQHLLKC